MRPAFPTVPAAAAAVLLAWAGCAATDRPVAAKLQLRSLQPSQLGVVVR
jgi:hypothetical protein